MGGCPLHAARSDLTRARATSRSSATCGVIMSSSEQGSAASSGWRAVILSAATLLLASPGFGQSFATLKGRITDASGAIVRGATIALREQQTGVERSTTSDAAGAYQFVFLPVGIYRIDVQSTGLRRK